MPQATLVRQKVRKIIFTDTVKTT